MVLLKGDITIQITYYVVRKIFHPLQAGIKSVHLSREVPFTALRHPDHLHPGMLRKVLADDGGCLVSRAVVYNDPFDWKDGLMDHRFDGLLDKFAFVPNRGD